MALLSGLGKTTGFLSSGLGKTTEFLSRPKVLGAVGAGAFMAGVSSKAGPATMDLAMTSAFGDPNVDRYFLGNDLSFRYFAGSMIGGNVGGAMRYSAPSDYFRENPPIVAPGDSLTTVGAMGIAGAAITGLGARRAGLGLAGTAVASIGGGIFGGAAGFSSATVAPTVLYAKSNAEFLSSSPYSNSRRIMSDLSASGDIVLGMHNSRRGY
jgi:hypothetical protein